MRSPGNVSRPVSPPANWRKTDAPRMQTVISSSISHSARRPTPSALRSSGWSAPPFSKAPKSGVTDPAKAQDWRRDSRSSFEKWQGFV